MSYNSIQSAEYIPTIHDTSETRVHEALILEWERKGYAPRDLDRAFIQCEAMRVARLLCPDQTDDEHHATAVRVVDRVVGLGPIEPLFRDPAVTEIMVNGVDAVYVERHGKIERSSVRLRDTDELISIIQHVVGRVGRRIDESTPSVDARLPDGSRVHAIIPPLALHGPVLTIRRFPVVPFTLPMLLERQTLSPSMAAFLRAAIIAKHNILISGGTGSGKTSTLNACTNCIPTHERIITIEDAAEIRAEHPHVIALESRPPNIEGRGEVSIRALVKNALRMRPDRIIVGETRGGEALDMLQAMNTGHQGSLTTIHANAADEALLRLETMALMSDVALPLSSIRAQIQSALHLIIHQERLVDGTRKIVSIHEVSKQRQADGSILLTPLFLFHKDEHRWYATEHIPTTIGHFAQYGVEVDIHWFARSRL